ncbi:MAG: amino acid adenylation domain-containing protein [Pseudonocardiaceae bacterium]
MTEHPTTEDLFRAVTDQLGPDADALTEDASLIEWGLDSIQLMQVANQWRRRGITVSFAQLARRPTLRDWRALLAQQPGVAAGTGTGELLQPAAPAVDPAAPFPLALMQHAYRIGREEGSTLGSVAAHLYVEFDGAGVQPQRLEDAVRAVVERHGMLRARFSDDGSQRIMPRYPRRPLAVHDLRDVEDHLVAAELAMIRDENTHARLDIEDGEVFAVRLSLLPRGLTRLHVDVDMLAADALSYRVLLADLARSYQRPDQPFDPIGYSYPQYLADRSALRQPSRERARRWWRQRVPELPSAPELPLVPETERRDPTRVARWHHWLPPQDAERLAARGRRFGLTPSMVVATAFAEVIAAWSAQQRFLLNVPLFDRASTHPEVEQLVGDFTGSVLLAADLTDATSFAEHARRLQDRMHTDAVHAEYSGVEVLRDLSRHQGAQVLAPVVFTSALDLGELFDAGVRRSFGEPVWIVSQGPQVLLDAQITEVDSGYLINWDVRVQAFPEGMMAAMFTAFHELVIRLARADEPWPAPVAALLPAAQSEVRTRVNATAEPRSGRLLPDRFFELTARQPDAPALLWGADGRLSYRELAERALRVASTLREKGVRSGEPVAIVLPKGPDQVVAVLGVLAAGAAYVPIGVTQPPARRERIRRVAGFEFALTDGQPFDGVTALSVADAMRGGSALAQPIRVAEDGVAYILFTSGSTGEPKGVEVPHRAAMNTIDDLNGRFAVGESDRCLAVSALDFDLSVYDLFGLLSAGGAVVLVDEDDRRDARQWAQLVRGHRVSVLNCVPALLDMLLLAAGPDDLASLRTVLLGGDRVGTDLPGRVAAAAPDCRFAGLGGTTETAIHSTVCEVDRVPSTWRSVPYGTPLRNVRCRVVDVRGRDCPDWVGGELWIGGEGVALGYRGDPERTAERFVEHLGSRWYRTGDLARYWPDGTLEFLGRRDHQVKIRGFRIELGEVESALAEHPQVHRAVATVRDSQLVAAVSGDVCGDDVRDWSRHLLPPHMVPARVMVLDRFPLTPNGKIDRPAVRELVRSGVGESSYVAPRTALEKALAALWAETLGVERIGREDRFFALGGDSVLATVIVGRLREMLDCTGVTVTVRTLFATLTVGAMAQRLVAEDTIPGRLERIAEVYWEVQRLSADEVDAELS